MCIRDRFKVITTSNMASVKELSEIGKAMGLDGKALDDFVTRQQTIAREDRAAEKQERDNQRVFENEKLEKETRAKLELAQFKKEKFEKEKQFENEKLQFEKEKLEKEAEEKAKDRETRIEILRMETALKEREAELKQREITAGIEQSERNREHEREQAEKNRQLEQDKLEFAQAKLEKGGSPRMQDFTLDERDDSGATIRKRFIRGPKMTPWNERDDMDAYLTRFEVTAEMQEWKKRHWAAFLANLLSGKALDVVNRLSAEDATEYDTVKEALLKRFNKTEEGFKQKFFTSRAEGGEAPQQFIVRLSNYLKRWVELAGIDQSYEGLRDLIVREQFLIVCSKDLEIFLREGSVRELSEISKRAEHYIDAHKTRGLGGDTYYCLLYTS